ncbi:unnamed protein product [Strongylus vulgaris]|uniref:Uncharacterized protein n=1 Tax=Strongylus vulgaris TaxID=40348 RepID=A0A3P7L3W0_STRVU|nr:unnamed protein product [Strongylus vulgaris]
MASGKPMAPSNTTQFLLEDREARAEQGLEVELAYEASERRRVRSISVSSEFMAASEGASSSGDSETDKEMDREFEAEFEEYTMDRLSRLSKDEMTREILDKEKNAEVYQENMSRMLKENQRLRKMLQDNGIPVDHNHTSQPAVPQLSFHPDFQTGWGTRVVAFGAFSTIPQDNAVASGPNWSGGVVFMYVSSSSYYILYICNGF